MGPCQLYRLPPKKKQTAAKFPMRQLTPGVADFFDHKHLAQGWRSSGKNMKKPGKEKVPKSESGTPTKKNQVQLYIRNLQQKQQGHGSSKETTTVSARFYILNGCDALS